MTPHLHTNQYYQSADINCVNQEVVISQSKKLYYIV